nr:hypothetical protein [Tanacetum cinerariifolium]
MVNTRTDADLSAAVQNALQTLLPQIRAEIREEFRTSSGPSDAGGNPPLVTIHTWLERFNKQKPHSFEKATAPTRLVVYKFEGNALAWWKAYKQAKGGDAWSTLNHLMCMSYTDVAQVANAARNYEILHERDDEDTERPDKRNSGTLFIYGHAICVLFNTGATHSVISSAFASQHHATIDYRSYQVIFGDIHAPEFIYHGSLLGKSMQIISALQARTLLSHGCE